MLYYTLLTYYYLLTFSISKIGSVLAFSKLTHFNPRQLATPLYSNIVLGRGAGFTLKLLCLSILKQGICIN